MKEGQDMNRYKILYIDTTTAPEHPSIVKERTSIHWDVAALAPEGLTPLMAIVVDLETGKAASFMVVSVKEKHLMYSEGGFGRDGSG